MRALAVACLRSAGLYVKPYFSSPMQPPKQTWQPGASSGCGWRKERSGTESSCEYIEQAVADTLKLLKDFPSSLGVGREANNSSP
jgi:hypothetical protein